MKKLFLILDVYKRQCMDSFRPYLEANRRTTNTVFHVLLNPSPEDKLTGEQLRAVSYTHLDVYKRQVFYPRKFRLIDRSFFCREGGCTSGADPQGSVFVGKRECRKE